MLSAQKNSARSPITPAIIAPGEDSKFLSLYLDLLFLLAITLTQSLVQHPAAAAAASSQISEALVASSQISEALVQHPAAAASSQISEALVQHPAAAASSQISETLVDHPAAAASSHIASETLVDHPAAAASPPKKKKKQRTPGKFLLFTFTFS